MFSNTVVVEAIPQTKCDTDDEDGPLLSKGDVVDENGIVISRKERPYAGKGRQLGEVITECWVNWTEQMKIDAKKKQADAMVDYSLALWRGNENMGIKIDRKAAYRWACKCVANARHCLFRSGNCGPANCHKCHAIILKKKMEEWFKDEEVRAKCASQFVTLHTPQLLFNICSFLEPSDLMTLRQVNSYFKDVAEDERSWAHLDVHKLYPYQSSFDFHSLTPAHTTCKVAKTPLEPDTPRYEAIALPSIVNGHFVVSDEAFQQRAGGIITPYTVQGVKILQMQWELKQKAMKQLAWERFAERKLEIPSTKGQGKLVTALKSVNNMNVTSKAGSIYTEAQASKTREIQALAMGAREALAGTKTGKELTESLNDKPQVNKAPKKETNPDGSWKPSSKIIKPIYVVKPAVNTVGKTVMGKIAASSAKDVIDEVDEEGDEDEDDDDDLEMLAAMLIAGEDVSVVTEKDKKDDSKWQEEEKLRIEKEKKDKKDLEDARRLQADVERERALAANMSALALVERSEHLVENNDVSTHDNTTTTDDSLTSEQERYNELLEYTTDFHKHRQRISNWNLNEQVMVYYPTSTTSLPLLYELLQDKLDRAQGFQYLRWRHLTQTRVVDVLKARAEGKNVPFYVMQKRTE